METKRIALLGQPNSGKSTIFNTLTGMHQHVGNWPGKTVEKKEGTFTRGRITYEVADLPGSYSLSANSEEEIIIRDYIVKKTWIWYVSLRMAPNWKEACICWQTLQG